MNPERDAPPTGDQDAAPAGDEDLAPPRPKVIEGLIKVVFGVAVIVFAAVFVWDRHHQLGHALSHAQPGWLVAALFAAALGQWTQVLGFRAVLDGMSGERLPVPEIGRVYFVSQLGKYIPGSVWPIVALTEMCRRHGIGRKTAAVTGLLALYFSLLSGGLVGVSFICAGAAEHDKTLLWLLLLVPACLVLLHPRVVNGSIHHALRLLRRAPVPLKLSGGLLRDAMGWWVLGWLLLGVQCWFLIIALGGPAASSLLPAIGGFALAYSAGTLAIPVPAGAGVREAVLGLALIGVVDQSPTFTHNSVIVVVLLSRGVLAVLDFAQAGFATVVAHWSDRDESAASVRLGR